jgi:hypothetical protein
MRDDPDIERSAQEGADPLGFAIGRDEAGQWIVVERHGLYGGIFGSEVAALRFAKFKSGCRRSSISMTGQPVHLTALPRSRLMGYSVRPRTGSLER